MSQTIKQKPTRALAVLFVLALAIAGATAPAAAAKVNASRRGVAIKGYDPVAYFTMSKPVRGEKDFETSWMNATWRFSSAGNRDTFVKDPVRYAPRYGGFCAYGVAGNALFDIDPKAWTVYEGRLYLNKSLKVRDLWKKDIPGNIRKADANWPALGGEMMEGTGMTGDDGMMDQGGSMMDDDAGGM